MDFSDSKLKFVAISDMSTKRNDDGELKVMADIHLTLSGSDRVDLGPLLTMRVNFAIPTSAEKTLAQIDQGLIDAAFALINRIAKETPDTLKACLLKTREQT
jgi:hypothetical protein